MIQRQSGEARALRLESFQEPAEEMRRVGEFPTLIGESGKIREILKSVNRVAPTDTTVLVEGESGTGKELVARAIHENSLRKKGALVVLDCAAINLNLIENELFGHEKGAYTGADAAQMGLVEIADGGTLFIDEIGEMGPACQTRFLRFIETGQFRRLGSHKVRTANLRIVAATNRSLQEEVKAKRFREDLYYRINVFHLTMPPLRERMEDIPLLAKHFFETSKIQPIRRRELSPEALQTLMNYDWPGNIRELANIIERGIINCLNSTILPQHLLIPTQGAAQKPLSGSPGSLAAMERNHIRGVLESTTGNKRRAAQILGISLRNLYRKIETYQIPGCYGVNAQMNEA